MKKIITILLLSIATNLVAQKDTLYFKLDTVWRTNWLSSSKKDAEFYRPMPLKKVGDLYQIKDYYINGNLQMEGFCTDPKKDIYHGKAIWYYKNENIEEEVTYNKGELNGLSKTYFKDGTLKTEGTYKNDKAFNGTFDECCPYATVEERKNGKRIANYRYYKDSQIIAEKSIKDADEHTNRILAYNKKGEQIAEVTVKPIELYIDGKNVWFNIDNDKNLLNIEGFATYKNGKLHGEAIDFDPEGKAIAKGINKNGISYSGTFIQGQKLKTYANGELNGKEITYSKGKIIAQGINKDDYHWEGQFRHGINQIATFKNGQPEGKQTTYYTDSFGYELKEINSYHHIINNKKEGESAYFDREGKEIAKGVYKNNEPFTGTFYNDYFNTLESYIEGKKDGLFIQYDNKGNITAQQEYENDKKSGAIKSTGFFVDRTCSCIYKNGEPFTGAVCEDLSVLHYNKGKIIKRETYNDDDQELLDELTIYNDDGELAQNTFFHKNKSYVLTYKKGKPFNGQHLSNYDKVLTTYKDGIKNGPFTEHTYQGAFVKGSYKNGLWDGVLTFEDWTHNKSTSCIYKDGKPTDGTVIENNCITNYKNGLKSGLEKCTENLYFKINNDYQLIYDSITQHYKKGKLDGKVQYFNAGMLVSQGVYKQNHKIEGTFYINRTFQNFYKDGKLTKSTYYFGNYKMVDIFKDWLIIKETTYKDDVIIYEGNFKNGLEYNGNFVTIDDKEEPRRFTHTHYKNGKKHGKVHTFNFIENKIEETNHYKDGVILQKIKKFPFKDSDSIIGTYKNGKPFSGHFYTEERTIGKIEHYKKSIKTGYQYYYSTTGSVLKTPLDSINYVDGKPFDGIDFEVVNKDYHKHFYKNGKRTKTDIYDIYYQGISDLPLFRVTPTSTGFVTSKSNNDTFKKYNELTYTNRDKTEGKVEFYTVRENGYLQFRNDELINVQIKSKVSNVSFNMYLEKPNVLVVDAKNENISIKMYPEFKLSPSPNYKDFLGINNLFFRGDGIAYFYLDDKLLGQCTLKKGKPYHGIVIRQYEAEMFKYAKYIEGERVEKKKGITKQELVQLLNKQKK